MIYLYQPLRVSKAHSTFSARWPCGKERVRRSDKRLFIHTPSRIDYLHTYSPACFTRRDLYRYRTGTGGVCLKPVADDV